MATSTEANQDQDYVDFDEYIDIQLRKTGSTIKVTDVLTAVVGVATVFISYLLLFVIFDHWLIPGGFGTTSRAILLAVVTLLTCGWLATKVVWPWRRRVSGLYAASTIEKASPGLKSSLVNLVDLSQSERKVSPEIYQSIERRAALALSHVDVNEAVDRRSLLRLSMTLLAVVVVFCLYWVFSPKNPATSLWRAIVPSAGYSVATRTTIDLVRPGDVDVIARSQLEVTADLRGQLPAQTFLCFTTADHKFVDERMEMRLIDESAKQFRCVINGENGAGILQNMTYRIVAGDASTRDYKIHVIQPPAATIESIRFEYPEYTRLEPMTQSTGAIDALEGTRVTLKATANMPLRSASVQFFDDEAATKRGEEFPIRISDGTKLQAEWKLEIRSDGTYPFFYRIFCTSTTGESEPNPSMYSVKIRPDQPPEIVLRDPKTDLELPANAIVPMVIEARDPDFRLRYINIKVEKDGSSIIGPEIYEGNDQQFKTTFKWNLKDYHFRPKETITYWLQAQDNRQPIANTSNTARLRIRIVDPIPEDQVKKNLEMAQQRQKEEAAQQADAGRANEQSRDDDAKADRKEQPDKRGAKKETQRAKSPEDRASGQEGNGGQPGNGKGDKTAEGKGEEKLADRGAGADTKEENKKQALNPDDPANDAAALDKLIKHEKQKQEKERESGAEPDGKGSKPSPESNQGESKSKSPDEKGKKDPGSEPQADKRDRPQKDDAGKNGAGEPDKKDQAKPNDAQAGPDKKQAEPGKKDNSDGASPSPDKSDADKNNSAKNDAGKNETGKNDSAKKDGVNENAGKKNGEQPKNEEKGSKPNSEQKPAPNANPQQSPGSTNDKKAQDDKANQPQRPGQANRDQHKNPGDDSSQKPLPDKKPGDQNKPGDQSKPGEKAKPDGSPQPNEKAADQKPSNDAGSKPDSNRDDGAAKPDQTKNADAKSKPSNSEPSAKNDAAKKEDKNGADNSEGQQPASSPKNPGESKKKDDQGGQDGKAKDKTDEQNNSKSPADRNPDAKSGDKSKQQDSSETKPASDQAKKSPAEQKKQAAGRNDADAAKKSPDEAKKEAGSPQKENAQKDRGQKEGTKKNRADDSTTDKPNDVKQKPQPGDANTQNRAKKPRAEQTDQNPSREDRAKKDFNEQTPQDPNAVDSKRLQKTDQKSNQGKPGDEQSKSGQTGDQQQKAQSKDAAADKASNPQKGDPQSGQPQKDQAKGGTPKDGAPKNDQNSDAKKESGQEGKPQQGQQQNGQNGKPSQQNGQKSGQGEQGKPGPSAKNDSPSKGAPSKGTSESKAGQSGAGSGDGKSNNPGGGGHNNGSGPGQGEGLTDTTGDANLDYAKKATDLVLSRLENQIKRGKVDKDVLKELGWTEDEVRRFVKRMRHQAQSAKEGGTAADEARRRQYEETLRTLNLLPPAQKRTGTGIAKSSTDEIEAKRSPPPVEYRELYEAFTRSIAKEGKK